MHSFDYHSIEDLIGDDSFKRWIIYNHEEDARFWSDWLEQNPDKLELVATAKAILIAVQPGSVTDPDHIEKQVSIFSKSMAEATVTPTAPSYSIYRRKRFSLRSILRFFSATTLGWIAVAGLIFFAGYGVAMQFAVPSGNPAPDALSFSPYGLLQGIEYVNNADSIHEVKLPDGSEVALGVRSRIVYASGREPGKREILLTGNAFFTIFRNEDKPLVVYSRAMIAETTGASFSLVSSTDSAYVIVKKGAVSVFRAADYRRSNDRPSEWHGTELNANQQAVMSPLNRYVRKSLVPLPQMLARHKDADFVFEQTPVNEIFDRIGMAYGITIERDEDILQSCRVSISLNGESFYEKIRLVCQEIRAGFQVVEGTVIIHGQRCP